jgi:hypothetical protein
MPMSHKLMTSTSSSSQYPLVPASPLTALVDSSTAYILPSHPASNSTASTRLRSDGSNELALSGEETDAGHHDTEVGERNDRQA